MKSKLYLYGIQTCKKCLSLIEELDKLGVKYEKIWCENSPAKCDHVEKITDCYMYPMLDIVSKKEVPSNGFNIYVDDHTLFYFDSEYTEGSKKKKLDKFTTGIPVLTLTEMIEKAIKELK
jgi:glutaredoxin-related protein